MGSTSGKKPELPLIQLRLSEPFVNELERRGLEPAEVLAEFSLERKNFQEESHYVTAPTMYRLAERLAEFSGDPHFGVHVGELMDLRAWPPTVEAARRSNTVGEYLLRFMETAGQQENSVTFLLNTSGLRTTLQLRRVTNTGIIPRHNDGFTVAYLLAIIRPAVGSAWDGSKVLAQVCDPEVIPRSYLGVRIASTDTLGAKISFPSHWLLQALSGTHDSRSPGTSSVTSFPAVNVIDAFRFVIWPHIHDPRLDADRAAEICGMKKRTLARKLQQNGTSISAEIQALRRSKAEREIRESDKTVSVIALDVGFNDPVVFSRAFKRWTGLTPTEFRKRHRA